MTPRQPAETRCGANSDPKGKDGRLDRTGRPLAEKERSFSLSALASLLRSGEFVVTAELNPPKSAAAGVVRRRGEALKGVVDAVNVTDLDGVGLVKMAVGMRDQARFLSGDEIKQPPKMLIGATASPFTKPMETDLTKTFEKIAAGAEFLQTQPVFDLATFSRWLVEVRRGASREVPILAGVLVLRSAEQAERLGKVPGLALGPEVHDRMKKAANPEAEGVAIAVEMVKALKALPGVRGVHIYAIEWPEAVARVVEAAGLLPRPEARVPA